MNFLTINISQLSLNMMIDYSAYKTKLLKKQTLGQGFIEQEVLKRLLDKLSFILIKPKRVLCIGSSHLNLAGNMQKIFPTADIHLCDLTNISPHTLPKNVTAIQCDIDKGLPYKANYFDLVISNLTLHKLDHTEHFIHQLKHILTVNGMGLFSLLGLDTLKEIAQAWAIVDKSPHIHPFFDMHDIGDITLKAGFLNPVLDVETLCLTYSNALKALTDIRALNDPLAHQHMRTTLTGKNKWQQFITALEMPLDHQQKIGITYEIIYGHVVKQGSNTSKLNQDNTAKITLDTLKQTLKQKQ